MKTTFLLLCLWLCHGIMQAQEPLITTEEKGKTVLERIKKDDTPKLSSSMNLQFYTSGAAYFTDWKLDEAAFKMNRVRWEILGTFGNGFSYHFRQSFNKYSNPHALDNLSSSVEYAFVKWKMSDRFALTAGKQILALGGYEYWVNSMKVREFSDFNSYLTCYLAGLTGTITLTPDQQLNLQVLNNRNGSDEDTFVYGLPEGVGKVRVPMIATINWDGYFCDRALNLRYSASASQLAKDRYLYYLTAGNVWERGPVLAYLDLMYSREGIDSKGLISELPVTDEGESRITAQYAQYFATIANFDYRIHPNWNVYVKGAYETGGIYKSNNMYQKGTYRKTWNAQACVEYFPMKNSELLIFLHFLYKKHKMTENASRLGAHTSTTQRISLGLVYTIPVF